MTDPKKTRKKTESPAGGETSPAKPKKPRKPRASKKHAPVITVAEYNELWKAYQENPSVKAAAKAAGVKHAVAKWYCEGPAWPEVGFVQLAQRLGKINSMVAEINDHGTGKFRARQLQTLEEGLKTTTAALAICQRGVKAIAEKVASNDLPADMLIMSKDSAFSLKDIAATHDKLLRAALLTMGEADSAQALVSRPADLNFAEWTADECAAYAERGIIPERFKK